jgi:hypothetical protein
MRKRGRTVCRRYVRVLSCSTSCSTKKCSPVTCSTRCLEIIIGYPESGMTNPSKDDNHNTVYDRRSKRSKRPKKHEAWNTKYKNIGTRVLYSPVFKKHLVMVDTVNHPRRPYHCATLKQYH